MANSNHVAGIAHNIHVANLDLLGSKKCTKNTLGLLNQMPEIYLSEK